MTSEQTAACERAAQALCSVEPIGEKATASVIAHWVAPELERLEEKAAAMREALEQTRNTLYDCYVDLDDFAQPTLKRHLKDKLDALDAALASDAGKELAERLQKAEDKADAGQRFKDFVHSYMDSHGIPHGDPENQHQKEGCRIGARLDLMFAERDALRKEADYLKRFHELKGK